MRAKYLLLGATALGLMLPTTAFAQDDGEIVVTARKRQESILKVPVVVTALGTEQIERAQINDIVDIAKKTTGLQLGVASVESGNLVSLRGYGTNALDPGVDASVSLNLDGLQITQGMAYSVGFFDMQQVEILKGPQALFFGKASPAGVISIRTADPGDEWEVIGRTGYEFVAREWRNELILSGPLSDTLGVRLAGMYDDFGGYFKNTATPRTDQGAIGMPRRFGETKSIIVRGTLLFEPTDQFSARLKLNYTRDRQLGAQPAQLVDCPEGPVPYSLFGNPLPNFFSDNEDCKVNRNVNIVGMEPAAWPGLAVIRGGRPSVFTRQKFGSLELNYDLQPDLTITSVTGYYKLETLVNFNCIFTGGAGPGCATQKDLEREDFTQELRLSSDFSGPLNFTLGGFYQDGNISNDMVLGGNTEVGFPPLLFAGTHDLDIETISLFGQARFRPAPQFEIAAGVRWTDEKRNNTPTTVDVFGQFTGVPGTVMTTQVAQPKLRAKNWSPELTLTYTPTDDLTVFASLKQAYKSGSYNLVTPVSPPGLDVSFDDERIRGGEIGIKTRLLDRQLNFNIAAYYYKVSNMQQQVILPFAGTVPILITLNAASAKIYGVDADFTFRPEGVPGLEIFGALNWNRARFKDFIAPCDVGQRFQDGCNLSPLPVVEDIQGTGILFPGSFFTDAAGGAFRYTEQDLSGTRLPRSPDWSGNIGFHYETEIGNGMTLGFGGDAQFSSKYIALLGTDDDVENFQGKYAKLNANISLSGRNDAWEIAFIGNNLTDKLTASQLSKSSYASGPVFPGAVRGGPGYGPAGKAETFGPFDRGRELWIRLTLRPLAFRDEEPAFAPPPPPPPPPPQMKLCPDGSEVPVDVNCPPSPPPPPPPPSPEGERG